MVDTLVPVSALDGRAVLVDVERHLAATGYEPLTNHHVSVADVEATLSAQGTSIEPGDIGLLHTGWLRAFQQAEAATRIKTVTRGAYIAPGLEPTEDIVAYLRDHQVAAVAADTDGVEEPSGGFDLHARWLTLIGMPLGEYWSLHDLAADCAADAIYTALLVSVPLNVRGGFGRPRPSTGDQTRIGTPK